MKNSLSLFIAFCLLSGIMMSCSRTNLGQLTLTNHNDSLTYCKYKIVGNNNPAFAAYNNGDLICIECCLKNEPPWPPKDQTNNICPGKIKFKSADGTVEYEADRETVLCSSCPEAKGYYACP